MRGPTRIFWASLTPFSLKVAVTTTLAAAGGALTTGTLVYMVEHVMNLPAMSNGILAGLVGITAGCATVEPWAAIVIGVVAGFVYCPGLLGAVKRP
jgi:Amt family ammonium transporter